MRFVPLLSLLLSLSGQDDTIRGDYIEDRSNHVHGCYCEWSGQSQTGGREATLAWRVDSGRYAGVDLAGVKFALVVVGDSNLSFGWSAQIAIPARRSVLLIDGTTSGIQARAVEDLVRTRLRVMAGHVLSVKRVDLRFEISQQGATVEAPGLFEMRLRKARLPDDNLPGAIRWYDSFLPMTELQLGTTLVNRWAGRDFQMTWRRDEPTTSGYYGRFVLYIRPES